MKKAKKKLEDGGVVKKSGTDVTSAIAGMITDILGTAIDQKKSSLIFNLDARENPADVLTKANSLDTGNALLSGAGKGAAIGSTFGPLGTAIGAGAGALVSGLGRMIGSADRKEDVTDATKDWSEAWSSKTGSAMQKYGYKKGGKIKGEGTGTSDSVDMDAEDGSFIVPVDNAEYAMELGREYLGWNEKEKAAKKAGDVDIMASNGEVMFTPQEVSILKYHGVDLDGLAPKAKKGDDMKKEGGAIMPKVPGVVGSGFTAPELIVPELKSYFSGDDPAYAKPFTKLDDFNAKNNETNINENEEKNNERSVWDFTPEMLSAIQAAGGAYGLMQAGRQPDMKVSATLKKLSSEVRKLSEFGYEPAVLNSLNAEIENTRRNISRTVTDSGFVSGLESMAQLNTLLSTTIDKKAGLAFADAAEKSRKYADVLKIDTMKAGQEFDINKMNIEDWYRNQEVFAGLVTSGISNIVGARQLKNEQDALKQIGSNNPT